MSEYEHCETTRLNLDLPTLRDLDALFQIHADARSWSHNPGRRHQNPDRMKRFITQAAGRFQRDGLGYWTVRLKDENTIVGWAGCSMPDKKPWWNLTYRIAPELWGHGLATEVAVASLHAAHQVAAHVPVLAYVSESNGASRRILERHLKLLENSRGTDLNNPGLVRIVYLDRTVPEDIQEVINTSMFRSSSAPEL